MTLNLSKVFFFCFKRTVRHFLIEISYTQCNEQIFIFTYVCNSCTCSVKDHSFKHYFLFIVMTITKMKLIVQGYRWSPPSGTWPHNWRTFLVKDIIGVGSISFEMQYYHLLHVCNFCKWRSASSYLVNLSFIIHPEK